MAMIDSATLQNIFAQRSLEQQNSYMNNQLQWLLGQGNLNALQNAGFNQYALGSPVPPQYQDKIVSEGLKALRKVRKEQSNNESWLENEVTKFTGNLQ